jgi:UDP:flavonoid glycosyltransferase YjiC (YdhE family)
LVVKKPLSFLPSFSACSACSAVKKLPTPAPGYVYVTMGSSADPRIFDTVLTALKALDVPAIVTTGGVRPITDFAPLPDRIRLYDFLPGSAAAAGASLVVCQGGIGTIYQALAAGKPLIGIPFMPEQEVYGSGAVSRLGAGLTLSAHTLTPEILSAAITTVLNNPSFTAAAQRLAPRIDLVSGPAKAADVVEGVVVKSR